MKTAASFLCALFLVLSTLPAQAASPKGVLIVAFGTSMASAMPSLEAIDKAYKDAYKGQPVVWAYTSDIIRKKLAKEGRKVFSVNEAMNECARLGIADLRVQPLHVTGGEEYSMLQRMLVKNLVRNPGRFDHVWLGKPLLESAQDLEEVASAVIKDAAKGRKAGEALVLMGHGNDRGPGDLTMMAVAQGFKAKDPLVYVATVEGANGFDAVLPQIKQTGVKTCHLAPLMVVAGDHANNDLAGDEDDSWASLIRKEGMTPVPHLVGLGQNPAVRAVYLRHTKDAKDDLAHPKKSD